MTHSSEGLSLKVHGLMPRWLRENGFLGPMAVLPEESFHLCPTEVYLQNSSNVTLWHCHCMAMLWMVSAQTQAFVLLG